MTDFEKRFANILLSLAADEFGNHGCNDTDDAWFVGVGEAELLDLGKRYYEWNGDPENWEGRLSDVFAIPDCGWMRFMGAKIADAVRV